VRVRLEHMRCEADPHAHDATTELPTVPRVNEYVEVVDVDSGRSYSGTVRAVLWSFEAFGDKAVALVPVVRYR